MWTSKRASSIPQRVEGLPPLLKVACGNEFMVVESDEGLWACGRNSKGQLGLGHTNPVKRPSPVQIEGRSPGPLRSLAALEDGTILIARRRLLLWGQPP